MVLIRASVQSCPRFLSAGAGSGQALLGSMRVSAPPTRSSRATVSLWGTKGISRDRVSKPLPHSDLCWEEGKLLRGQVWKRKGLLTPAQGQEEASLESAPTRLARAIQGLLKGPQQAGSLPVGVWDWVWQRGLAREVTTSCWLLSPVGSGQPGCLGHEAGTR